MAELSGTGSGAGLTTSLPGLLTFGGDGVDTTYQGQIQGGLGLAPGANLNPEGTSMFEPIHGSAPKYKGQNKVNPIATIWAGALLLDHLGQPKAAEDIVTAIERNLFEGRIKTYDLGGSSTTSEVGTEIARLVRST